MSAPSTSEEPENSYPAPTTEESLAWLESGEDLTEVESEEGWIDAIQIMPYGKPQS